MRMDGVKIKLYDDTIMAHEMPPADHFTGAMSWVDELYQVTRGKEVQGAAKALDEYTTKYGSAAEFGRRSSR